MINKNIEHLGIPTIKKTRHADALALRFQTRTARRRSRAPAAPLTCRTRGTWGAGWDCHGAMPCVSVYQHIIWKTTDMFNMFIQFYRLFIHVLKIYIYIYISYVFFSSENDDLTESLLPLEVWITEQHRLEQWNCNFDKRGWTNLGKLCRKQNTCCTRLYPKNESRLRMVWNESCKLVILHKYDETHQSGKHWP